MSSRNLITALSLALSVAVISAGVNRVASAFPPFDRCNHEAEVDKGGNCYRGCDNNDRIEQLAMVYNTCGVPNDQIPTKCIPRFVSCETRTWTMAGCKGEYTTSFKAVEGNPKIEVCKR